MYRSFGSCCWLIVEGGDLTAARDKGAQGGKRERDIGWKTDDNRVKSPSSRPAYDLHGQREKKRLRGTGGQASPGRPRRLRIESYPRNLLMR